MSTIQDERPAVKKAEYEIGITFCDLTEKRPPNWETKRRLFFLSTVLLTPREARELLDKYHGECEDFDPACLVHLPRTCMVRIGREYSLVLYIETQGILPDFEALALKMKANEFSLHQSVGIGCRTIYRLWWD